MAQIKGLDKLLKKLNKIDKNLPRKIEQVLDDAARKMRNTADQEMRKVSPGIVYGNHQASKPGDYPNVDQSTLVNSLFAELLKGKLTAKFGSRGVPYARALEFGTSRMAARPWLKPSLDKHKEDIPKEIDRIIKEVLKNG